MSILNSGLLFCAAEFNNHICYQVKADAELDLKVLTNSTNSNQMAPLFNPRDNVNMISFDEIQNIAGITDMRIDDLVNEGQSQVYLTCGKGAYSTLRVLRHGLSTIELAKTEMPNEPTGVFTLKEKAEGKHDKFIVVSF